MRRLEDEIGRAQRHGSPLALAILDLDEFKVINDSLGHAAGDEILRCYASQVLSMFRQYDMVSRYGGEEFAVLLPTTTLEGATCALRKVQMHAAALRCDYDGRSLALPTFSCGLTLYLPRESLTSFLERADRALYRAKHLGRNRIEVYCGQAGGGYEQRAGWLSCSGSVRFPSCVVPVVPRPRHRLFVCEKVKPRGVVVAVIPANAGIQRTTKCFPPTFDGVGLLNGVSTTCEIIVLLTAVVKEISWVRAVSCFGPGQ